MKKIILSTIAALSLANAGATDAENLLNFLFEGASFKCEKSACVTENYIKEDKNGKAVINSIKISFTDNTFPFKFNKEEALKAVEKTCENKSETPISSNCGKVNKRKCPKTSEKAECLTNEMLTKTGSASKKLFSVANDFEFNGIVSKTPTSDFSIEKVNIHLDPRLVKLTNKEINKINVEDINFDLELNIKNLKVPTLKSDLLKTFELVLPTPVKFEQSQQNFELISIPLKTLEKINNDFVKMYGIIIDTFIKNKVNIEKDINSKFSVRTINDTMKVLLTLNSKEKDGFSGDGELLLKVNNMAATLEILKGAAKANNESALMGLMGLAQNVSFKHIFFNADMSSLKKISDSLNSNKEFVTVHKELQELLNSKEYKEEAKNLNVFDRFKYKTLLLNNNNASFSVENKNNVPLMMLFMTVSQGGDISKVIDIQEKFQ